MVPAIPIISLTICIFSSFLIFTKQPRYRFDSIYSIFAIFLAFPHLGHLLVHRFEWGPEFLDFAILFTYTYGPLLLLYIRNLTTEGKVFRKTDIFHFLPFICLQLILFIKLFFLETPEEFSPHEWHRPSRGFHPNGGILSISMLVYSIWIFVLLNRHRKNIVNHFSNIDSIKDLRWMYWSLVLFGVSTLVHFILEGLHFTDLPPEAYDPRIVRGTAVMLFSSFFCWFGVRQTVVYTHRELDAFKERSLEEEEIEERKKYEKSGLREDMVPEYLSKIRAYMESEKPYKDSEFSIDLLSENTEIPRFYITQILSETLETNFYNFVNEYRIKDISSVLKNLSEERPNFLRLALEYGFNSKSTFNTSFKKVTGKTPTQFLEEISKVSSG
ncbi:helix-turn-helix domain-containing protein [Leptospira sarikeiensis]|uniref:Helix-turn-helix domain-containing protein n=1 Tax=Leptospira sarikeiensis TaxID=2484943 RepID=A0A4R9KEY6_9LEPT|nr:helix-turn-helix domain-containing protein [Leptospira sarikeiensis]TGL65778.1 helix-turn-helix domain-containing protein [Leptospira sarikeiensis]